MKYVEFYKTEDDGTQTVVALCKLIDNVASCEGEVSLVENITQNGIIDNSGLPSTVLFPKDGEIFLEKLCVVFKSGYLNASKVLERQ